MAHVSATIFLPNNRLLIGSFGAGDHAQECLEAHVNCQKTWISESVGPSSPRHHGTEPPSAHIEALDLTLKVLRSGVVWDSPEFGATLWHPSLGTENMRLSPSPEPYNLTSLLDWSHAHISPTFVVIESPVAFEYHHGRVKIPPLIAGSEPATASLPEEFSTMSEREKSLTLLDLERANLHLYYFYKSTSQQPLRVNIYNMTHRQILKNLVAGSGSCWHDSLPLIRSLLFEAQFNWGEMFGGLIPCPLDISEETGIRWLEEGQVEFWQWQKMMDDVCSEIGCNREGLVEVRSEEDWAAAKRKRDAMEGVWDEDLLDPFLLKDGALSVSLLDAGPEVVKMMEKKA